MITHPAGIAVVLLTIVAAISVLAEHPRTRRFLRMPPAVLWIYLLPTTATTLGLLPSQSPLYGAWVTHALPGCLLLLLLGADIRAALRLGPRALGMMLVGSFGVALGCPAVIWAAGELLPAGAAQALGTLGASWIGGSANMIAVKESLGTPDAVLLEAVVVDAIVAYGWMALLIALAPLQPTFDRWVRTPQRFVEQLGAEAAGQVDGGQVDGGGPRWRWVPALLALGATGSLLAGTAGSALPSLAGVLTSYTWTVLIVSALGVALSFARQARALEQRGASRVGNFLLYLVLACIGARADLRAALGATRLLLAGAACITLHGLALLGAAWLLRAPLFLLATASQANVGGPVSAPVVAAAHRPQLAHVGLLLAVLGNVYGTYLGILCGQLCRLVSTG